MFEGSELPVITAIEVHHDDVYVHGVQTFYQDGKETALHCAPLHDGCRKERFEFEEDEYMVEVGGRFGHWCDNIWLKTSEGRFHEFGGTGGGHVEFSIDDVDKPHILSVGAGVGGHLHHLKVVYVDHEKYETEGEKKKKMKKDSPKKEKEDSDKESKKSKKSSKKSDSDSSDKSDKKKKKKGSKSSKKSDSDWTWLTKNSIRVGFPHSPFI